MKKINLFVAIALLATSSLAIAEDDNTFYGLTPTASVALTTDYMWRGVSQTNNDPAIQGSFDLSHETGLYVGAWASNVEFGDMTNSMELDVYGGFANETDFGGVLPFAFGYDVGILRYEYSSLDAHFTEAYIGGSISPFERFNLSTYWYYGIKMDHTQPGEYTDISADYTLPDSLGGITFLAHAGYYNQKSAALGDSYWEWKLGIAKDIGGFNFEVAYHDTDNAGGGNVFGAPAGQSLNDGRIVATISRSLGETSSSSMLPDSITTSASVALTTDYIWRGVSQTNNEPAIQGSFDIGHESGVYAGAWASSFEFGNASSMELDLYAGFSRETNFGGALPFALTYDIGFLRYEYTSAANLNFNELYFGTSISPVDNLNLSAYYFYGLNTKKTRPGEYTDLSADYTLPEAMGSIIILGHVGYYNQKEKAALGDDYWDWKAGIARDFGPFNIEVAYTDTDDVPARNAGGVTSLDDGRFVGTLSATF